MQGVQNFGSLLQGYALKRLLTEMGHTVNFIDIERKDEDYELLLHTGYSFADEVNAADSFLAKLKKIDKYFFIRLHNKVVEKREFAVMDQFREAVLQCDKNDNEKEYDYCVIGSDEVFNCLQPSPWGFTSQLYGNVRQAKHVITYAASVGSTSLNEVPEAVQNRIRNAFKNVEAFSVRDVTTYTFVKRLSKCKDIHINFDPVFITDFSKEIAKSKPNVKLPDKYCLVYAYPNRIHDKNEINSIRNFCHKHDLEMITVGMGQKWVENMYALNPFELLYVFSKAAFVITDTFHGAIFSSKYSKRYAIHTRRSNANKLDDLIRRVGIENHHINNFDQLEEVYALQEDKSQINEVVSKARTESVNYFERILGKTVR